MKLIDSYGVSWELVEPERVWNEELGFGLWDNGRDLRCPEALSSRKGVEVEAVSMPDVELSE